MVEHPNTVLFWSGAEIREDVLDVIYQITPEDTPFFNLIGDSVAMNPLHQWPVRSIAGRAHNAVHEGAAFAGSFQDANVPTRVSNITQIPRKLPSTTRTQQSVRTIGVSDLMADQIEQRSVEFKMDIETALLRGSLASGATDGATVRQMGGFHNVITTNAADYAAATSFDEQQFNDLMETIWSAGGRAQDVLVGSKLKRRISSFTDSATKYFLADDRRVTNTIGVYESDFHVTNIHLSRDLRNADGDYDIYAFDRSFFAKAWLDQPIIERLPKTTDGEQALVIAELTLEYGNEAAGGLYTDLGGHGIGDDP